MTISSLVAVFRYLDYEEHFKNVSLLNQALSKIPPNIRESWSLFVVKRNWSRPNLIDFNNWLKDKAEAHEQMKNMPGKPKIEEPSKTKAVTRVFASTSTVEKKFEYPSCILCKGKHALWKCSVFKGKTPTQRAKFSAENKLCFSCLQGNHAFRQGPRAKKCTKPGCTSTHSILLHGAERVFSSRNPDKMIAIQDPTLVKQDIMQSRIKRAQMLIENHSARIYRTQVRIMQTLIPFRLM